MDSNNQGKTCSCPHHKVVPIIGILLGLDFLLGATGTLSANTVAIIWPILVIIAAGTKLGSRSCKCC